jgi:hypothetical protein
MEEVLVRAGTDIIDSLSEKDATEVALGLTVERAIQLTSLTSLLDVCTDQRLSEVSFGRDCCEMRCLGRVSSAAGLAEVVRKVLRR